MAGKVSFGRVALGFSSYGKEMTVFLGSGGGAVHHDLQEMRE